MRLAALATLLLLLVPSLPARAGYWDQLECDWQQDLPGIRASIDAANASLRYRCDSQLFGQTYQQFHALDRASLARYNRGVATSSSPRKPRRLAAEAVVIKAPSH